MKIALSLLTALILCAAPLFSLAERRALSRQEAVFLMDAMEKIYCAEDADIRSVQRENEQHTREWEKKYGYHIRWDGDLMADYVLEYGMMPTHDAPYANPLAVYPDDAKLTIPEAKRIAAQAVSFVEDRLPVEKLTSLTCLWEYDYSRDLGWWWTYDGTWVITMITAGIWAGGGRMTAPGSSPGLTEIPSSAALSCGTRTASPPSCSFIWTIMNRVQMTA